jgi:hypothetical protein
MGWLRFGRREMTTLTPRSFISSTIQWRRTPVSKDHIEIDALDQGGHADRVVTLAQKKIKSHEVSKSIGENGSKRLQSRQKEFESSQMPNGNPESQETLERRAIN